MFGENKNLKDPERNPSATYGVDSNNLSIMLSYTKTNKLITALYMVTDIMDKDEPLRQKLRTLGLEIISDINSIPGNARSKISEIMSFLGIASDINIISQMNCNILRKEFLELNQSLKESTKELPGNAKTFHHPVDLSELFKEDPIASRQLSSRTQYQSIGHPKPTRIGVQKGSTLMKALSDRTQHLSDKNLKDFNILKKQRQDEIINSIKRNGDSATITDIRNKAEGALVSCGEKTLQRELVSMVKSGVLNKTGEKRWSRYSIRG